MTAVWIPPVDRSKFMANMMASSLGAAVTMPLCGYLIEYINWESVFYVTGKKNNILPNTTNSHRLDTPFPAVISIFIHFHSFLRIRIIRIGFFEEIKPKTKSINLFIFCLSTIDPYQFTTKDIEYMHIYIRFIEKELLQFLV